MMWWDGISPLLSTSKNPLPQSNYEKNIKQTQIGGILQNSWPVLFKTVKVIKNKTWETITDQRTLGRRDN